METSRYLALGGDGNDRILAVGLAGKMIDGGDGFDTLDYSGGLGSVASSFTSGVDGWTADQGASVSEVNDELRGTKATSGPWNYVAPAKFLGDQSDKVGGALAFDLRQISGSIVNNNNNFEVQLSNGQDTIQISVVVPNTAQSYALGLTSDYPWATATGGAVSDELIESVLSNLTSLVIRGDHAAGGETGSLDNVVLSSQPLPKAIHSNFETGRDGWTIASFSDPVRLAGERNFTPDFSGSNGIPGGRIQESDPDGGTWYFKAPDKFLGDQSDKYGGEIAFELRQISFSGSPFQSDEVIIRGGLLTIKLNTVHPGPNWTAYSFAVDTSADWQILGTSTKASEQQIRDVLSEVRGVFIRGEYISGSDVAS
ncbi:MAG: laminin B domain-containing protein, partial [Alphaproteobacteria bacterium]